MDKTTISIPTKDVFFGRSDILDKVNSVLKKKGNVRVINIQGEGGIGKTSLLKEIKRNYSENSVKQNRNFFDDYCRILLDNFLNYCSIYTDRGSRNLFTSEIIDFFDISTHTKFGMMEEIIRALGEDNDYIFEPYRNAVIRYDELRYQSITGRLLEEAISDIERYFQKCFNNLSRNFSRVCILIDTFEIVQSSMGDWLADLIKTLDNSVFIIAGRKNFAWNKCIEKAIGSKSVSHYELTEFKIEDVNQLFDATEMGKTITKDSRERLKFLSKGRPILLAMFLDWKYLRNVSVDFFTDSIKDCPIKELENLPADKTKLLTDEFEDKLASLFFENIPSHNRAIFYMAVVYKCFNERIFSFLDEISFDEAKAILGSTEKLPFMKYNHRIRSYQLHDLLREMITKHASRAFDPTKLEMKKICGRMVDYYKLLINDINSKEEKERKKKKDAEMAGDIINSSESQRKLIVLKNRKQIFMAHQVYYHIVHDITMGLKRCRSFYIHNLWQWETQANTLLKKERADALEFTKGTYKNKDLILELEFDRSCTLENIDTFGTRYMKTEQALEDAKEAIVRYMKHEEGLKILEMILGQYTQAEQKLIPFLIADIYLYMGIGNNFESSYYKMEENHNKAISLLTQIEKSLSNPDDINDLDTLRITRSLARSFSDLAYGFNQEGRLTEAVGIYKKALHYCKRGEMLTELSFVYNDLSFVLARLGLFKESLLYWRKGLSIREDLLSDYLIGLSKNNRGIIAYLADTPHVGVRFSEEALSIFERINNQRGIGLACRALGGLLARIADIDKKNDLLDKAEQYLKWAIEIFVEGGKAPEPYPLAETAVRMAYLYRTRYSMAMSRFDSSAYKYLDIAKNFFNKCISEHEKANTQLPQAMATGRLCELHISSGDIEGAENLAYKMETILHSRVPDNFFKINNDESIKLADILKIREMIYPMGILEKRKAQISFEKFKSEKKRNGTKSETFLKTTAIHITRASAFFESYAEDSFESKNILTSFTEIIDHMEESEIADFKKQIVKTLNDLGVSASSKIMGWIEHAEALK